MRDCLFGAWLVLTYVSGLLAIVAVAKVRHGEVTEWVIPLLAVGVAVLILRARFPRWDWVRWHLLTVRAAGYVVLFVLAAIAINGGALKGMGIGGGWW